MPVQSHLLSVLNMLLRVLCSDVVLTIEAISCVNAAAGKTVQSVRYKFHEGFTNAVKRPVRMKDLM